ncbi:hypothetical protein MANES_17G045701v8 [Manihot esculenta]|uniref:Uncharacterized protein n=1 Tax=Manihot esculenta TaxID=3983 RepID=A0ACB7G2K6_MANES|nr:hypothetical protein MANES_17G045701v8 [Manihot esculenta]
MEKELCADHPNAFWNRKQHLVDLPYEENFNEKTISTKARPVQMATELLENCKIEIKELEDKKLISIYIKLPQLKNMYGLSPCIFVNPYACEPMQFLVHAYERECECEKQR